ncbi:unnamed protein product [Urochloa humidicola]
MVKSIARTSRHTDPQPLVDTEVRRSDRKKQQLKGFKNHTCMSKDCLGCSREPPTLSPSVIKNLGVTFCKLDVDELTSEALSRKRKVGAPGGKKPPVNKPTKQNCNDEDKTKKPNKKQPRK